MTQNQESIELQQRIQRSFGLLAFIVNRHLIDHMRRLVMELDMDFEAVYLYGTVAHLSALKMISPSDDPMRVLNSRGMSDEVPEGVRLADVVQVSGLPRETVRRKLEWLQTKGKLLRTADGLWCYDPQGINEHTVQFTIETIERFLKTADEMQAVLDKVK